MKKVTRFLLCFLLCFSLTCSPALAAEQYYKVQSSAVILMDADTGKIIYSKNRDRKMYPASITKIMTGLLVMEHCSGDELVTASASATSIPAGYAHVGLNAGDTISVRDAMYALMLPSANDAANALAEHVAGSQRAFASMMNARAAEIGADRTSFVNASGMPADNHYTTAYDMALITAEAIKNQNFMRYFGATEYMLPALNSKTKETKLTGYQYMMLSDHKEYDSSVIGGKIGYTGQAGHTMSTVATRNGHTLICVVLGSGRDSKYADTRALLDYGFRTLQ